MAKGFREAVALLSLPEWLGWLFAGPTLVTIGSYVVEVTIAGKVVLAALLFVLVLAALYFRLRIAKWRSRARAVANGVAEIFQEEATLPFKEIALRWENADDGKTATETVFGWLIQDTWLGKFENIEGHSRLTVPGGYSIITRDGQETFLNRHDADATRRILFGLFARDCNALFQRKFGKDSTLPDTDWSTMRENVPWGWMANVALAEYDVQTALPSFRKRILDRLTINRADFETWLSQTKRPLPRHWYERG